MEWLMGLDPTTVCVTLLIVVGLPLAKILGGSEYANVDQDRYKALEVKTKNGKKSPVFLNTGVNLTPTSQKMQMSYPPPLDKDGPASNYSLVWILIPLLKGEKTDDIPLLPSTDNVRNELGIDPIEGDQPHLLSNFVAPKAFLHVEESRTGGTFDVYFQGGKEDAARIYYKERGDVHAMWTVYTDKKTKKQFLYSLLPSPVSPKADPNQINQIYAINQGVIETQPKQPWPPLHTYVWSFTKDFTVVKDPPII